ncbi:MAG: hypothetical protein ABL958_10470 [Bdellovibrionia bacterium]
MNKLALILAVTMLAPLAQSATGKGQAKVEVKTGTGAKPDVNAEAARIREAARRGSRSSVETELDKTLARPEFTKDGYAKELSADLRAIKNEKLANALANAIASESTNSNLPKEKQFSKVNIARAVKLAESLGNKADAYVQILTDAALEVSSSNTSLVDAIRSKIADYRVDQSKDNPAFEKNKDDALAEIKKIEQANKEKDKQEDCI